jgi:hypothetical protein
MEPGDVVILHLVNPTEKFWGVMDELSPTGVTLHGLNLGSFEDWVAQCASDEESSLGLATMFVPLFRVERIFLDQQVGQVQSYEQRFERRVGVALKEFVSRNDGGA